MKEMDYIKETLEGKLAELEKLKNKVEKSLEKTPEGSLILSSSNDTVQYYHKTNKKQKKGKYISKKEEKKIAALAQKDYDYDLLNATEREIKAIKSMLKNSKISEATEVYDKLKEGRRKYVNPHFQTEEELVKNWLEVKYEGKKFAIDAPVIITEKGERVRSKTEKIIADKLYALNIPYRYECPIRLKGYGTVYPDFTLLNRKTRKEIYLEHFGMMDNAEYCEKSLQKINDYINSGFRIGKDFLFTFETSKYSLNMRTFEKMIKEVMQ